MQKEFEKIAKTRKAKEINHANVQFIETQILNAIWIYCCDSIDRVNEKKLSMCTKNILIGAKHIELFFFNLSYYQAFGGKGQVSLCVHLT